MTRTVVAGVVSERRGPSAEVRIWAGREVRHGKTALYMVKTMAWFGSAVGTAHLNNTAIIPSSAPKKKFV